MTIWRRRPVELAQLLNPAFCAVLMRASVQEYHKENPDGMPFAMSFFVLPVSLHSPTRAALPKRVTAKMHVWLQHNPQVLIGFAQRMRLLAPPTKEAHIFAMRAGLISVSKDGFLVPSTIPVKAPEWPKGSEALDCYGAARFLGRWFPRYADLKMIFALWGVRP
jgi:hypothetical protein